MTVKPRHARGRRDRWADHPPILYPPGRLWSAVLGAAGSKRARHVESFLFYGLPMLGGMVVLWAAATAAMVEQAAAVGGAVALAVPWWWPA